MEAARLDHDGGEQLIEDRTMYKYLIIAGGFSVAIAGLVFLQPNKPDATAALPAAPQAQPAEMAEPITQVANVSASVSAPAPQAATASPNLLDMTNSVLAGLGVQKNDPTPTTNADQDQLRAMTSSVLAGLGIAPVTDTAGESGQANPLGNGQSDDEILALLSVAIDRGLIEVPKSLRTAEGEVDKATMIAQLARAAAGEAAEAPSDDMIAGGVGVEVRVVQQAGKTVQYRFYTVQRGDSLGAIAHKFYGDAAMYSHIYEANRRLMPGPDQIRVGQRLTIPALSDA